MEGIFYFNTKKDCYVAFISYLGVVVDSGEFKSKDALKGFMSRKAFVNWTQG